MSSSLPLAVGSHPLGIKPLGNAWFDGVQSTRSHDLGYFSKLEDAFLLQLLIEWLDAPSLLRLSAASRSFYALGNTPSVWREKYIADFHEDILVWHGSWRAMYAAAHLKRQSASEHDLAMIRAASQCQVSAKGVYSEAIYHEFMTSAFDPAPFLEHHARLEQKRLRRVRKVSTEEAHGHPRFSDNFTRVNAKKMSAFDFVSHYAEKNYPCILVHATEDWPCRTWSLDYICQAWGSRIFQAEAIRISGRAYIDYARSSGGGGQPDSQIGAVPDTSPFYLFDATVAAEEVEASKGWRIPSAIVRYPAQYTESSSDEESADATRADLFSLMGAMRPDYRWLIAGPARSGSGWHKDPNMTSAWNAVMHGTKYWMMLPPDVTPPGVFVSEDHSEVTAPASLSEWMLDFYAETKAKHGRRECGGHGQLLEGVCAAGEVMYVPSGWWHLVINLDESVALTQNFVSKAELSSVLAFMKYSPDQISGFRSKTGKETLYDTFLSRLLDYDTTMTQQAVNEMKKPAFCAPATDVSKEDSHVSWRERLCQDATATSTWSLAGCIDDSELGDIPWS